MPIYQLQPIPSPDVIRQKLVQEEIVSHIEFALVATEERTLEHPLAAVTAVVDQLCEGFDRFHQVLIILSLRQQLRDLLSRNEFNPNVTNNDDDFSDDSCDDIFAHINNDDDNDAQADDDNPVPSAPAVVLTDEEWHKVHRNVQVLTPELDIADLCALRLSDLPGVIRINLRGQPAAFFKPGDLRRQNDAMLHALSKFIREKAELPDAMPDVFCLTVPGELYFSDINFGKKVSVDSHLMLIAREKSQMQHVTVPIKKNTCLPQNKIVGGLQPALPAWQPQDAQTPSQHFIALLLTILLLSPKDMKADGLGGVGSGSIYDFEEFLELYKAKPDSPLPSIWIPFHTQFSDRSVSKQDLLQLKAWLTKLSEKELLAFLSTFSFDEFNYDDVANNNIPEDDEREAYAVERPRFLLTDQNHESESRQYQLLSEEQKALAAQNLLQLHRAVDVLISNHRPGKMTIFEVIGKFDPIWFQHVIYYRARCAASTQQDYRYKAIVENAGPAAVSDVRWGRSNPDDYVGSPLLSTTPTQQQLYSVMSNSGIVSLHSSNSSAPGSPRSGTPPASFSSNSGAFFTAEASAIFRADSDSPVNSATPNPNTDAAIDVTAATLHKQ